MLLPPAWRGTVPNKCNQLWVTDDVSVLGKINKLQKKTDDVLDIIYWNRLYKISSLK